MPFWVDRLPHLVWQQNIDLVSAPTDATFTALEFLSVRQFLFCSHRYYFFVESKITLRIGNLYPGELAAIG